MATTDMTSMIKELDEIYEVLKKEQDSKILFY